MCFLGIYLLSFIKREKYVKYVIQYRHNYGNDRIYLMSRLQEQNPAENAERYRTKKLPAILSEMQAGNANQRETTEYNNSQRASRTDAEPIVKDLKIQDYRLLPFVWRYRHVCYPITP